MNIRWIKPKDMNFILEIEKESFPEPWTKKDFDRVFANKDCVCQIYCDADTDKVLGYLVYEYDKVSYNLVNFAVAPKMRRQGIGKALIQSLISHMENSAKRKMFVSISDKNLTAQLFMRKMGFRAEKISRNFYGPDHNAYEFILMRQTSNKEKDELCRGT